MLPSRAPPSPLLHTLHRAGEGEVAPRLVRWLNGMRTATVHENSIMLPAGVEWPDLGSRVLYVREFYKALWETALGRGVTAAAVILGTPGSEFEAMASSSVSLQAFMSATTIFDDRCLAVFATPFLVTVAKSAFGLYAVFRTVAEGGTVIYDSRKGGRAMFKDGEAYPLPSDISRLTAELDKRETLYVSDGKEPVALESAFTLLISSPGTEDTKWFEVSKSENVRVFTIPCFTGVEMEELHALAFADKPGCKDHEEVAHRMRKWGNNPRNVFTQAANDLWQGDLEIAASSLDLPALLKQLQRRSGLQAFTGKDVRHRLLNMVPRGSLAESELGTEDPKYYVFHHCELSSVYVEERFATHIMRMQREQLYSFLHVAQEDTSIAGFRGILYERAIVIPRLQSGGTGLQVSELLPPSDDKCERAHGLSDGTFGRGSLKLSYFGAVSELRDMWSVDGDGLFVPLSKHFPAVDLVLRLNGQPVLVNATVGLSHDIKVSNKQLTELLEVLGLDDASVEVPFVWVLPQDAYTDFKAGRLVGASRSLSDSPRHVVGKRLAQYKLLLPVPSSSAAAAAVGGAGAAMAGAGGWGDAGAGTVTDGTDGGAALSEGTSGACGVGARAAMDGGVGDGAGTSDSPPSKRARVQSTSS